LTKYRQDERGRNILNENGEHEKNSELIDAVFDYFREVKKLIGNHYHLGVYGNGFTNRILQAENLITHNWVSASRSFEETAEFVSRGQWHLFQNQIDRRWFEVPDRCPSGMDIDTNVQNPFFAVIGSWGSGEIEPARTKAIFAQRRFALQNTHVYRAKDPEAGLIERKRCRHKDGMWQLLDERLIERSNNVRVLAEDGRWAQVDIDDDGAAEGYCFNAHLTPDFTKMPPW
jgi:hypothetical protein